MAAISLKTGTSGIKPRNYRVFLATNDYNFNFPQILKHLEYVGDNIDSFYYEDDHYDLSEALALMAEVGECRSDSIDLSLEDGESIEGNTLGKVVLGKSGSFSVELINATPDNINQLSLLDGKEAIIILVETNTSPIFFKSGDYHDHLLSLNGYNVLFVCNLDAIFNGATTGIGSSLTVTNKITGNGSSTVSISINNNYNNASSFRKFVDFGIEIQGPIPTNAFTVLDSLEGGLIGINLVDESSPIYDGLIFQFAEINTGKFFDNAIIEKYVSYNDQVGDLHIPSGYYNYRACGVKNGKILSSFSGVQTINVT